MKRFTGFFVMFVAIAVASVAFADDPSEKTTKKRELEKRSSARSGLSQLTMDPAKLVPLLLKEFDTDHDQKLDAKELTQLLTKIRERRGRAAGARAKRNGKGQSAARKRDDTGTPGGDIPKRPN